MTAEQRAMALRLRAKGLNFKEIGEEIDASLQTAWNVVMKAPTRTVKTVQLDAGARATDDR
jgi:orotate phosphoribosyltransferase-like protein